MRLMDTRQRLQLALVLLCPLFAVGLQAAEEEAGGFVQRTINGFEQSEFEFQRSISNAPFPPLGFVGGAAYSNVEVESPSGKVLEYDVQRFSAMAGVPFLLGKRDALVAGAYVSWSEFDVKAQESSNISVASIGLPIGWMRQQNPDWQLAAFVMPLGHDSDLPNSDWAWQYLGGAFARYVSSEKLWWAFGFYADVGSGDNFYIPYLGASWAINQRWTLSAIMPWPALIYAPTSSFMVRLGASPSGASWSLDVEEGEVGVNLDAWDFGLGAEYRIFGNFWLGADAGIGGLRGLRLINGDVEEPDLDFSSNGFVKLNFNYRPATRP
jgi:hypothetical protein